MQFTGGIIHGREAGPFLFLKTKHLKGIKKYIKKLGIYFQIIRDDFRNQKVKN